MPHSEKIEFPGAQGETLAARLELPDGPTRAYALFAHCFTCSKDIPSATRICRALATQGIATLRFDFTGLGGSQGDFANTNFSSNVEDLVAAVHHLRQEHRAPTLLVGHSLGGTAILAASGQIPEARATAVIGSPFGPDAVRGLLRESADEIERKGEAKVEIAGSTFRIRKQFLEDIASHDAEEVLARLETALLVLHAPADEVVPIAHGERIFGAAPYPKSFLALDGADHLLRRAEDAIYTGEVIAAWASRYLGGEAGEEAPRQEEKETNKQLGIVVVEETGEGRYINRVQARGHVLLADEPLSAGGNNAGPNPYDLLLAGLGACTSMTLRMYAERKGWQLERVRVDLVHEKIHAEDCASCETKEGRIDRIEREITLSGNLAEEQRARLIEIAERCPVHRTLNSEVQIHTTVPNPVLRSPRER